MNGKPACALHQALGRIEACPGADCAFWETDSGCAFEQLGIELETRPGIARWLLDVRATLEETRAPGKQTLQAFLPPGLRV